MKYLKPAFGQAFTIASQHELGRRWVARLGNTSCNTSCKGLTRKKCRSVRAVEGEPKQLRPGNVGKRLLSLPSATDRDLAFGTLPSNDVIERRLARQTNSLRLGIVDADRPEASTGTSIMVMPTHPTRSDWIEVG